MISLYGQRTGVSLKTRKLPPPTNRVVEATTVLHRSCPILDDNLFHKEAEEADEGAEAEKDVGNGERGRLFLANPGQTTSGIRRRSTQQYLFFANHGQKTIGIRRRSTQ